jgi:hypothetical protein
MLGIDQAEFKEMGIFAAIENLKCLSSSSLKKKYETCSAFERNVHLALEMLDSNHDYRIESLSASEALISARPTENIQEIFKRQVIGTIYTSIIKEGGFTGIPYFSGDPIRIRSELLKSIHQGDDCCLYKVTSV